MASSGHRPPIIAAFAADSAAREPVEFGLAASRVTGAPLIIVSVAHGDVATHHALGATGDAPKGAHTEALAHLANELEERGLRDVDMRLFEDRSASRGLAHAIDELGPELIVLEGRGMVALSVASKPLPLSVTPELPVSVPSTSVITWSGSLTPRLVDDRQLYEVMLPADTHAGPLVRLEGTGRVLVEQTMKG